MANKDLPISKIDQLLIEHYGITFEDTGYEEADWLARFGGANNEEESVHAYAEKYNLKSIKHYYV